MLQRERSGIETSSSHAAVQHCTSTLKCWDEPGYEAMGMLYVYLVFPDIVCAMIGSLQVVLKGTPIHDPSTRVVPTNRGLSVQDRGELVTRATK